MYSLNTLIPHVFFIILHNYPFLLGLNYQTQTHASQLLFCQLRYQSLSEGISNATKQLVRHIRLPQVLVKDEEYFLS